MSEDLVTITVDGKQLQAPKGAMLITVTDANDIRIPRFCYHKKLSVAANCRMCLVDVEKAPKPMPACATPVMDGMVVHTRSEKAIAAQKAVMEFLLINHPLDCPICDQGGECELQDNAMGYGDSSSQYTEIKRVVFDRDIGPLIATELTRCIQCTRCVRFGEEISGMRELGATDRGDRMKIGTFIEKSVDSELSGNVIDICPVGALTSKPARFKGRSWEMRQHAAVAPHDSVGSNIFVHTLRGEVVRVVPKDNEAINEVWLSDRDRFSYEALESGDRLTAPMIKENGEWREAAWEEALQAAAKGLGDVVNNQGSEALGAWISPNATLEEQFLLQKLVRALGSNNIDHRLHQNDFSDQDIAPVMPWLGQNIEDLEQQDSVLLVGSNVRKDQPLLAHRIRKSVLQRQAKVAAVNLRQHDWHFELQQEWASPEFADLASLAKAALEASAESIPAELADTLASASVTEAHKQFIDALTQAGTSSVLLGNQAQQYPGLAVLRQLSGVIARATNSRLGMIADGANGAGAWLAGAIPHRTAAGQPTSSAGKDFAAMLSEPSKALITFGVEPELDSVAGIQAPQAMKTADFVVAINAFVSDSLKDTADVILPLALFTETSGTYVNGEGQWQAFRGVTEPAGDARPGWKILRVLGNLMNLQGFDYLTSADVAAELKQLCQDVRLDNSVPLKAVSISASESGMKRIGDVPIYAVDGMARRAASLQKTTDARQQQLARMNAQQADKLSLGDVPKVRVRQDGQSVYLSLVIDDAIPDGCIWIPAGIEFAAQLGSLFGPIEVEAV